jgi:hypothetical protein
MPSGAVHPNTGNFSRVTRLTVVDRVRKLVAHKAYETRPEWLQFVERAPPMELTNLKLRDNRIKSPYPAMIRYVLEKFPDMRFQDCFVDGNDWSRGNDKFRSDHPVMQFVARQLELINSGSSRQEAFELTKEEYLNRRLELEKRQKLEMALAQNKRIVPAFGSPAYASAIYTTGAGIARQREAELEVAHLNHIRRKLRMLRKEIEPHDRRRMSAKEVALDMEAERVGLLPKLAASQYQPPKTVQEQPVEEIESEAEPMFEFVSGEDEEFDVFEPSVRNPRPVDVSWEAMAEQSAKLVSTEQKISPILKSVSESKTPSTVRLQATKPAFTLSRPDKQTVQAILSRKKQEEIQRRIGKEPGDNDDGMDFEDFMNMINKPK